MIIVFSGTDGAGKSTQIAMLNERLQATGRRTRVLWARGGYTPVMLAMKSVVLILLGRRGDTKGFDKDGSAKYVKRRAAMIRRPLVARVWLAAAIIDLILLYGIYVRLLSFADTAVICDRYIGDTRIDFEWNFADRFRPHGLLWRLLVLVAPKPAIHFVLAVPVAVSKERSRLKNEPFPDDEETLTFRYAKYHELAEFNHPGVVRLDGTTPLREVSGRMLAAVGTLAGIGGLG